MIVLDACVLIAHFNAADAHHDRAGELLAAADEPLAASSLSLAEILVGPARTGQLDRANAVLRRLDVTGIGINGDAAAPLALLRTETRLKMPDCCVLLAAQQVSGALATFDDRLATAARRYRVTVVS